MKPTPGVPMRGKGREKKKNEELEHALRSSIFALDAWVHLYAPEFCAKENVETFRKVVFKEGGTLAFIAKRLYIARSALQPKGEKPT